MKIIIIGGIAAGMSAAAKARRTNAQAEITVIEKEDYVSFGACGLPYYLGDQFTDKNNMFARTVEQMQQSGINVLTKNEVTHIDFDNKQVEVHNQKTSSTSLLSYDRLMIATGGVPMIPNIEGIHSENAYTMTKLYDAERFKQNLAAYKHIAIVGGGFIGIEVAEQLAAQGKKITLFQADDQLMNRVFDQDFATKITEVLTEQGVNVHLSESLTGFECVGNKITKLVTKKQSLEIDAVVIAIGFKPNTAFITDERLVKLPNGAIQIDEYGQTSIQDVFSAGDCATIHHRQLGNVYIPLATYANKMGRIIGTNIVSSPQDYEKYSGALGSSEIQVGHYEAGVSGLTELAAANLGINYGVTSIQASNHTSYVPGQSPVMMKLVYEKESKVLLGAQVFGKSGAVLRLTAFTTAIYAKLTTQEIGFIDYAYSPPFATTWDAINVAANTAK